MLGKQLKDTGVISIARKKTILFRNIYLGIKEKVYSL